MRAMILAAGRSTRLGPLTAQLPKPMLRIGGRPVLSWTLAQLRASGVREVIINLHHAPTAISDYFRDGSAWDVHISYVFESQILGTAGGVKNAQTLLHNEPFLVVYGDNVLDWDPSPMVTSHCSQSPIATIAVALVPDARHSGLVRFDQKGEIDTFVEKPGELADPRAWVNAGFYVLEPAIFDWIADGTFSDFGIDVFPKLLADGARLRAFTLATPPIAIDTPEAYRQAQVAWRKRNAVNQPAGAASVWRPTS
jgi:NDP-sugar pyrophosphorylase family protein